MPLGGPESGEGKARAPARARNRGPAAARRGDAGVARRQGRRRPRARRPTDDDAGPAPTSDLGAYGPQGSRLTVLMRLDRLRGTDYAAPVDELLMRLPDRRDFVSGTGLDLFTDFDALLVATPNPLDPSVTFVAVRHHLDDAKVRAALNRGAKASDHTLTWRTQDGRPVAERRPRGGAPAVARRPADHARGARADGGDAARVSRAAARARGAARRWRRRRRPAPDGGGPDGGAPGVGVGRRR